MNLPFFKLFYSLVILVALSPGLALAKLVTSEINYQGDAVHLEFTGLNNWIYEIKRDAKNRVDILMDPLSDESIQKLTQFKSDLIKKVSVNTKGTDGKNTISLELFADYIEYFDYQTDTPSRLIIDFYITEKNEEKFKKAIAATKSPPVVMKAQKRKPATTDVLVVVDKEAPPTQVANQNGGEKYGIYDGSDGNYERFSIKDYEIKEEAIIRSKENYYIKFPMLRLSNKNWDKVKVANPIYNIVPKETDENKMARLLMTLFQKKRYLVYLKTLNWFQEKYPASEYNEIIDFMTGDVYFLQWSEKGNVEDFDQAIEKYKKAIKAHAKTPLAERLSLMLGYLQLERGDNLSAIRYLNEHIGNPVFGDDSVFSKDLARLGIAQAYMNLNKYDLGWQVYDQLENKSKIKEFQIEAAYRKGDGNFKSENYTKAIEDYQRAINKYPENSAQFPNSYFNQAESLFQLEKYRESMNVFKDYLKKFPSDPFAAFAITRLGETLEILGADPSRSMGAYLETYFRFGESPNAIIARLRLLSSKMKGMKPKEVEVTVKEIMDLASKSELADIQQFSTIMVADGYTRRTEFQKAIDLLIEYYQAHPNQVNEKKFRQRIVSNINEKIYTEIEDKQFIKALKTHESYIDSWLKGQQRLDTPYYVGRAFELGGAGKEAEKYYREVLNKIYSFKGSAAEKELLKFEHLPSEQSLNLRLAAVMTSQNKFNMAYESLRNIKQPELLSEKEQIERVSLAVTLLEKRGDLDSAVRYLTELIRNWKGLPSMLAEPYLKLAHIELQQGKFEDGIQSLQKIDDLMHDSKDIPWEIHATALEKLGDLNLAKKDEKKAKEIYEKLLSMYEEKKPLSSIRYLLGKMYFKDGEIQKATEIWTEFKNDKANFWKKISQEQLENSKWKDDYKKYIKRIPAMEGKE